MQKLVRFAYQAMGDEMHVESDLRRLFGVLGCVGVACAVYVQHMFD